MELAVQRPVNTCRPHCVCAELFTKQKPMTLFVKLVRRPPPEACTPETSGLLLNMLQLGVLLLPAELDARERGLQHTLPIVALQYCRAHAAAVARSPACAMVTIVSMSLAILNTVRKGVWQPKRSPTCRQLSSPLRLASSSIGSTAAQHSSAAQQRSTAGPTCQLGCSCVGVDNGPARIARVHQHDSLVQQGRVAHQPAQRGRGQLHSLFLHMPVCC